MLRVQKRYTSDTFQRNFGIVLVQLEKQIPSCRKVRAVYVRGTIIVGVTVRLEAGLPQACWFICPERFLVGCIR